MEIERGLLNNELPSQVHLNQEARPQAAQSSQVEIAKRGLVEIEREKGPKALAYTLGMGWFQARLYSFPDQEQAIQSFFPKLMTNSEFLGIFHTAIQHETEEQVAFDALFNSPHPLSEQEREEKLQKWTALTKSHMAYMKQLAIPRQQPQETIPPAPCEEGKQQKRSQGFIPLDHIRECTICSA